METTTNPPEAKIDVTELKSLIGNHEVKWTKQCADDKSPRGQMHLVSSQLRMMEMQRREGVSVYDPITVSIGPYHHGSNPAFSRAEEFKRSCLDSIARTDAQKITLYNDIFNVIQDVRRCYAEVSKVNTYDDKVLTFMMLLDACFIVNFMKYGGKDTTDLLGMAEAIQFTARDIMLLENQIPLFVLQLVIKKDSYNSGEYSERNNLQVFLSWMLALDFTDAIIPNEDADPPLHILEACRRVIAGGTSVLEDSHTSEYLTCPSVTTLKAKGIAFRPSSSHYLKAIKFKKWLWVWGKIKLPVRSVSELTQVILSNMIAYELSPTAHTDLTVLSYTHLMKSLIQTPDDVKELQDKGIIRCNRLSDLEQVVQLFKRIDTFGLEKVQIYDTLMQQVGDHCNTKVKTWIAELFHAKLKSPWGFIALAAATLIIVLTFLQTWYAIHPAGRNLATRG